MILQETNFTRYHKSCPNVNPKLYRVKKEAALLLGQDYFLLNKDLNPISYHQLRLKEQFSFAWWC